MKETVIIKGNEYHIEREIIPGFSPEGQRLLLLANKAGIQFGLIFAQLVGDKYQVDHASLTTFKEQFQGR